VPKRRVRKDRGESVMSRGPEKNKKDQGINYAGGAVGLMRAGRTVHMLTKRRLNGLTRLLRQAKGGTEDARLKDHHLQCSKRDFARIGNNGAGVRQISLYRTPKIETCPFKCHDVKPKGKWPAKDAFYPKTEQKTSTKKGYSSGPRSGRCEPGLSGPRGRRQERGESACDPSKRAKV